MKRPIFQTLSILILIAIVLTACGGDATTAPPQIDQPTDVPEATEAPEVEEPEASAEEPEAPEEESPPAMSGVELPQVNPADVPGDVVSAGSSTVFPLAEVIAGLYEGEGGGNITIDSIGSGAGFERFCVAGESDVSNASRAIRDSEVESCQSIGREPIEFRVGTDAIAVTVSTENDFVTDVTMEELAAIFSTAETWSDVRPDWPNESILRYIPGTDSGTFDYFVEEVFDEDPEPILNASDTNLSEDDNVLVQGVVGSPYAVAFYGYAYYVENADVTNVLSINGIQATLETVDSFTYPLARPLFIYSDASIMQEKPQVAAYINYFLTHVNEVIDDVGYFPANDEVLNLSKLLWLDAMAQ
jgi:phosphate transport system substrate-binding protein